MTTQSPTSNRRAFLSGSAAVAVGAAGAIPIFSFAAAPSRAAWQAVLHDFTIKAAQLDLAHSAFNRTEAAYSALQPKQISLADVSSWSCDTLEEMGARIAAAKEVYARSDELVKQQTGHAQASEAQYLAMCALDAAVDEVLLCPAPDLAAVAEKIQIATEEGKTIHDLCPFLADLRHLGDV